jgi:hypothetical protein
MGNIEAPPLSVMALPTPELLAVCRGLREHH